MARLSGSTTEGMQKLEQRRLKYWSACCKSFRLAKDPTLYKGLINPSVMVVDGAAATARQDTPQIRPCRFGGRIPAAHGLDRRWPQPRLVNLSSLKVFGILLRVFNNMLYFPTL